MLLKIAADPEATMSQHVTTPILTPGALWSFTRPSRDPWATTCWIPIQRCLADKWRVGQFQTWRPRVNATHFDTVHFAYINYVFLRHPNLNHPYFHGLYHPFMVNMGMISYCFTTNMIPNFRVILVQSCSANCQTNLRSSNVCIIYLVTSHTQINNDK